MKTTITRNSLRAVIRSVAENDIYRPALCGVLVETDGTDTYVVGTDGRRLTAIREGGTTQHQTQQLIIPLDAAKAAAKLKQNALTISYDIGTNTGYIGGIAFTPVYGTYPSWRRVIPRTISGEPGHYLPRYVDDAFRSAYDYLGITRRKAESGSDRHVYLEQNGERGTAVVRVYGAEHWYGEADPDFISIVMPIRPGKLHNINRDVTFA